MNKDLEFGIGFGAACTTLLFLFIFFGVLGMKSPETWCGDIATASKTEPYKVVYDRCMVEYRERVKNQ